MIAVSPYIKKLVGGIGCCLLIITATTAIAQTEIIVGYINNHPVAQAELDREISRHKSEVMNRLTQQYHLNDLSDFWSREFDGIKADDILKKTAWNALGSAIVQEQLVAGYGLWPYKNHKDFILNMEKVNAERQEMKTKGQVIYGPVLFTEQTFYEYKFSNAIIKLKDKLFPKPIAENLLLNHYEEMQKTVYTNTHYSFAEVRSRVETSFVDQAYNKLIADKLKNAQTTIK